MIRTFIAVQPSAEVRLALAGPASRLTAGWPSGSVRRVRPEGLHLTLRFLGATREDQLPSLTATLDEVTACAPACELALGAPGAFPDGRRPRVLWVGLEGSGTASLRAMRRKIDERVSGLGWDREDRPFRPHLTLGRVRPGTGSAPFEGWTRTPVPELAFPVDQVVLMRSDLRPDGARYSVLHRSPLRGDPRHPSPAAGPEAHEPAGPGIPQRTGTGDRR